MNVNDCIVFANENPVCFLATVEGDQPRVRAMGFWFADETGFYFQTGAVKSLYTQLRHNPAMEVAFLRHGPGAGTMLRISGEVEFLNDVTLKERAIKERPFLLSFGLTAQSPGLIIFRLTHGQAHFWNMENNLKPKDIIEF